MFGFFMEIGVVNKIPVFGGVLSVGAETSSGDQGSSAHN